MKKIIPLFVALCFSAVFNFSCKKTEHHNTANSPISQNDLEAILAQGFDTAGIDRRDGGYMIEGDMFLPDAMLGKASANNLIIAKNEQYHTTYLVTALPRNVTISTTNLPAAYAASVTEALNRYAALNLRITFTQVAANGNINIANGNLLPTNDPDYIPSNNITAAAASGFPQSLNGNPWYEVGMNVAFLGQTPNADYLATIIAHEIGHCIGFRHTDYLNISFSCGSGGAESTSPYGAVWIPGTPTGPNDPASWMLACNYGVNRPFNANDVIAINYLYGVFYNILAWHAFQKSCPSGQTGNYVSYTVPAGKYSSMISQADADQQAQNDINANGQNYANANGVCNVGVLFQIYSAGINVHSGAVANLTFTSSTGLVYYTTPSSSYEAYYIPTGTYTITATQSDNLSFSGAIPGYPNSSGQQITFNNVVISGNMTMYITDK